MPKRLIGGSDASGNFKLDVARGIYPNVHWVDKFGANFDIDVADASPTAPLTVWEFGRQFGNQANPEYIYVPWNGAADPINAIVCDNVLDTGIPVLVAGSDFTGAYIQEVVTLNGQTPVSLANSYWRVYRLIALGEDLVTGTGPSLSGNCYCYQGSSSVTLGVPDDVTKVKAVINDGFNQTQMCIYTIPKGLTGYLMQGEAGIARSGSQAATSDMCYRSRRFGGAFTLKKSFSTSSDGSSFFADDRAVFDVIPELTDIELCVTGVSRDAVSVWGTFDLLLIDENAELAGTTSPIIAGLR